MTIGFWFFWVLGLALTTLVGAYMVNNHRKRGLAALSTFLAIYVVGANILVPRLVVFPLFGLSLVLVTGSIIWPYTAQLSDMINEIYGKKSAYVAAALSYFSNLMFVSFVQLGAQFVPIWDAPQEGWWSSYFGVAGRVLLASISSYTAANYCDIRIFSRIKVWAATREGTLGNLLLYSGLRSALSDGANMIVDNIVFYTIAFIGTMPFSVLLGIIGSSMLVKFVLGQIDVPFYWAFRVLTRNVSRDF